MSKKNEQLFYKQLKENMEKYEKNHGEFIRISDEIEYDEWVKQSNEADNLVLLAEFGAV